MLGPDCKRPTCQVQVEIHSLDIGEVEGFHKRIKGDNACISDGCSRL